MNTRDNPAFRMARFVGEAWSPQATFSKKKVFSYVGCAASINLGDLLLYLAIRDLFKESYVVPNSPISGVKSMLGRRLLKSAGQVLLKGFSKTDGTLLGGGTLINDIYFLNVLKDYYRDNIPFYVMGTSVECSEMLGDNIQDWAPYLKKAKVVFLRDQTSHKILEEVGIDATVIGDPVLSMTIPKVSTGLPKPEGKKKIGINVGSTKGDMFGSQDDVNKFFVDLIQKLKAEGNEITIFSMHPKDLANGKDVATACGISHEEIWDDYHKAYEFLDFISEQDMIIGQRLHAVICGTGFGIPSISISYRPKCINYMKSIKAGDYCHKTSDLDLSKVLDQVENINDNYEQISHSLITETNRYRSLQKEAVAKIQALQSAFKR